MSINQLGHQIDWYQIDTGQAAYCYCNFDLSVTYGPLEAGDYNVNVYYTESWNTDTIFEGTTDFSIGAKMRDLTSDIISQYQSECYSGIGITDLDKDDNNFMIYPNPAKSGDVIHIMALDTHGKAVLEIYSTDGRKIYTKQFQDARNINDLLSADITLSNKGAYFLRLITSENTLTGKIIVM